MPCPIAYIGLYSKTA